MSESEDELYAKALKYRDNKVPEWSPEESRVEAEKLFLELSQQGNVKAMHNYVVLQQKKGNYKLAAEWFDKAGLDASKRNIKAMKECGQIKEDIYLVVARDRSNAGNQGSPILDCVYGTGVDLSHTRSFNGNATTCDISRCALPGAKHIIADALTFDFAKKYNLKHVLIERLPTINPNEPMMGFGEGPIDLDERGESDHKSFESEAKVNFFGSVVQNLSKAMESGAILEIEWDPYTTLWHLNREESKEIHTLNPFHGFILNNAAVLGAQLVNPDTKVDHLSPELQAVAHEYGEKFRHEIVFWHSQGGGESPNEIYNRMHAEVELYRGLMEADKRAPLAFVEANIRADPTEKVIKAIRSATFDSFPAKVSGKRCQLPDGRKGVVYCARSLIADGLFGTAMNSLCVQNNILYAKRFLESIGFVDVVIERRTNTHNGRKNVWMVKAVKGFLILSNSRELQRNSRNFALSQTILIHKARYRMMSTSEELYAKALKYRDNKVPECSPEESRVEAEKLFLELSLQGDVKAMHNYAVLQQKKGNYKLAAEWFDKAGLDASKRNIKAMRECGQIKEDLYLVVANERSKVGSFGPFMDAVYGDEIDYSHRCSFGGNATTCDIKRCAIPDAKHITADVLTFDFAKKYNLKHVLIERLPTLNETKPNLGFGGGPMLVDKEQHNDLETDAKVNYFGAVIQNLSKAMEPGAILEIEWDPYSTQITQTPEQCEEYNAVNPFHGFMSMEANFCGAQCAKPHNKVYFPPQLQEMAREYGKKFQQEVEFWHSQGAGTSTQEICDRLKAEVELMIHLMNATVQDKDNGRKLAFVEGNILTDRTEKVIAALKNATYGNFDPRLAGKPVQMSDGRRGYVHDACSLVPDSIYGIAIHSLCVQNNIPYAKRFLESIGFVDVVIERRTNIHNGRKNVWMVKAVKG